MNYKVNNGWKEIKLKELVKFNSSNYSKKDNWSTVNYLDTGNMTNNVIDEIKNLDLSLDKLPSRARRKVKKGDILYSTVRPIQKHIGIINNPVENMLVSTGFIVMSAKQGVDPYYIYSYLDQDEVTKTLQTIAEQRVSTYPAIKLSDLEELLIKIPSLEEQKNISHTLKSFENMVSINNKIIANLEQQCIAIYRKWFKEGFIANQYNLIQEIRDEFPRLGPIPVDWEVVKAQEVFDISIGRTPPRKQTKYFSFEEGEFPWASIRDMRKGGIYLNFTEEKLTDKAFEDFNIKVVPKNTVILSFKLTVGLVSITNVEMATNEAIAHFSTDNEYIIEYLYLYLKDLDYSSLGNTSSIGTAINSTIIKNMPFILPRDEILESFSKTISPFFNHIRELENKNKNLIQIRTQILPKLMTGELKAPPVK